MRFTVEQWAPEYGSQLDLGLLEPAVEPDLDVESPRLAWAPITPAEAPAESVVFVDGVRRVDASVWIDASDSEVLGLCASYAAGAVLCDGEARMVGAVCRRGLFTSAPSAQAIVTDTSRYEACPTPGQRPEELWLGIQQRMGELEGQVAASHSAKAMMVVDGPLSHRRHVPGAVGYVKTQHVQYLPADLQPVLRGLLPGQRTPLFLIAGSWSRFSWYLRLPGGGEGPSGLVRCEMVAEGSPGEASRKADSVAATLPRFASEPHKEPRSPQNLYPIAGLERELRRRLGDERLLYRELRRAARQ